MDLQLAFNGSYYDLVLDVDLAVDHGLQTAVVISLLTDRRAKDSDQVDGDRRGWWGDTFAQVTNDQIGSRLWLLRREKALPKVAGRAEEYAREALTWMLEDGVAKQVVASARWVDRGTLYLAIDIVRPTGERVSVEFDNFWEAMHVSTT